MIYIFFYIGNIFSIIIWRILHTYPFKHVLDLDQSTPDVLSDFFVLPHHYRHITIYLFLSWNDEGIYFFCLWNSLLVSCPPTFQPEAVISMELIQYFPVKSTELKLRVCTSITCWLLILKLAVVVCEKSDLWCNTETFQVQCSD